MMIFVPCPDVYECAHVLDLKRLGRQRSEALGILRMCLRPEPNYARSVNHPLVRMWQGYEIFLWHYIGAICTRWKALGYEDTVQEKADAELDLAGLDVPLLPRAMRSTRPPWWGWDAVHSSHRATLLAKDYKFYSRYGWSEAPQYGYTYWTPEKQFYQP